MIEDKIKLYQTLSQYHKGVFVGKCCRSGDIEMLEYILKDNYDLVKNRIHSSGALGACEYGHLETVKLLHSLFPASFDNSHIRMASKHNHLEIVEYFVQFTPIDKIFEAVCSGGHLRLVERFLPQIDITEKSLLVSCYSEIELFKAFLNEPYLSQHNNLLSQYAYILKDICRDKDTQRLEILLDSDIVHKDFFKPSLPAILSSGIRNNFRAIYRVITEKTDLVVDTNMCLSDAIEQGSTDVIEAILTSDNARDIKQVLFLEKTLKYDIKTSFSFLAASDIEPQTVIDIIKSRPEYLDIYEEKFELALNKRLINDRKKLNGKLDYILTKKENTKKIKI